MIACRHIAYMLPLLMCVLASAQSASLQRGVILFQRGDYEASLRELKAAVNEQPKDASVHNLIGITETKLGHIDDADSEYKIAIQLDPSLSGPYKNLGFNLLNRGQYNLAEAPLQKALQLDQSDPFAHYYLVILYLSTERSSDAVPYIAAARELLGNDATNGILSVKACLKAGDSDDAVTIIRLLESNSLLSASQEYETANLLTDKGMYADAVPLFRRLAQRQPASWENKYNLAIAYLKANQPNDALELLRPLADEHPENANIRGMLASAYELEAKPSLAQKACRDAIALEPQNPNRYLDCTRLMADQNQFDEAIALLRQGIGAVQDPYVLKVRIGAIETMRGRFEAARVSFNEAISAHPDIALGYVALAQTYMKEGNNLVATQVLMDGRSKVPQDFALEYVLGLISYESGNQEQALEALRNAERLGPDVVEPHYQLGMLYMQKQKWQDAQNEFESVLKLNPRHAASYYQLSRTYERLGNTAKARQMAAEASVLTRTQREDAIKAQQQHFDVPSTSEQP